MFYSDIGHRFKMKVTYRLGVELFVRRYSQSFIATLCPHPSSFYRSAKIPSPSRPFSTRFMCKELRPMISPSLHIDWYLLGNLGAQIIVSLFHKNTPKYFSVYFCSLYLFSWRSNALSHVFRLMARKDELLQYMYMYK